MNLTYRSDIKIMDIRFPIKLKDKFYDQTQNSIVGLIFTGISILSSTVIAAPSQTQIDALRDIYNDLNGQEWTDNTGWDTIANPCEGWTGVTCDASGTNVSMLFLDNNNAFGSIPASISDLTELQELVIIRAN